MQVNIRLFLTSAAALLFSACAFAQTPAPDAAPAPPAGHGRGPHGPGSGFGPGPFGMELMGFGGMHGGRTVTGVPFTATAVGQTNRTLADGTKISQTVQSNLYRDAQGRVRKEVTLPAGSAASNGTPKSLVVIHDPVAGTGYVLDASKKIAHAMPQHSKGPGNGAPAAGETTTGDTTSTNPRRGPDANVVKESLGTQTINGVAAQGTRYTRTIPAGRMGNDKPLTIVREEWYSPDLQIIVQSKRSDPFVGETTYNVTNIQRTAPSPTLFTVPSEYTVQTAPAGQAGRRAFRHRGGAPPAPAADAPGPGFDM
jgi:hypothetical protein